MEIAAVPAAYKEGATVETQAFEFAPRERVTIALFVHVGPTSLLLILSGALLLKIPRGQSIENLLLSFSVLVLATYLLFRLIVQIREAGEEGWYGARFELSAEGIKKRLPSGDEVYGRWDDLEQIGWNPPLKVGLFHRWNRKQQRLEFRGGTVITISPSGLCTTEFYLPIIRGIEQRVSAVRPDLLNGAGR